MQQQEWVTIIEADKPFDINLPVLWRYRDLIKLFVYRDFVAIYKQTLLGPLWFFFQPLVSVGIFTIVFGLIAKIPTDSLPHVLFYMSGIVMWNYFSQCLVKTSDIFGANAAILGKVYFPRMVIPISTIITNLIVLAFQFVLFLAVLLFFYFNGAAIKPNWVVLLTPLLVIWVASLAIGCGTLISALTTKYKDLTYLLGFGVQLWMYATPIVYPLSQVPEYLRWLYLFNPMSCIVSIFRYAFTGAGAVDFMSVVVGLLITFIILICGLITFSSTEKYFADTV